MNNNGKNGKFRKNGIIGFIEFLFYLEIIG